MLIRPVIVVTALLLAGCTPEPPSQVFVPGPAFQQSIRLSTAQGEKATVRVSEPLVLHAERRTGPWIVAARNGLATGACWIGGTAAPELESEVADNVHWNVAPAGAASFNTAIRHDHTREVRFTKAGVYSLSAISSNWCPPRYGGNTLTVEVTAR